MTLQVKTVRKIYVLVSYMIILGLWFTIPIQATGSTDPALLGEWYLDAMHGQSPAGPSARVVTIYFVEDDEPGTLPELSGVYGDGPCNYYSLGYHMPAGHGTWDSPTHPASTKMGCADPILDTESAYFSAFSQVTSYEIVDQTTHQRLIMYNAAGEPVLEFVSEPEFATTQFVDPWNPMLESIYLPIVTTN